MCTASLKTVRWLFVGNPKTDVLEMPSSAYPLFPPPRIRSPIYIYSDPIIFTPGLTSKYSQVLGFAIPSFRSYKWVTIEI